ncbi:MAG: hypothetical protein RLY99_867 [Pseudomonadota bacterium]
MQDSSIKIDLEKRLNDGIQSIGLTLSTAQIDSLLDYLLEFQRWNKTHNLSAIHDLEESLTLHLLDSLVVLPYLDEFAEKFISKGQAFTVADLGTGGGLPGIPLAICRPEWQLHLMEVVQKKTVFLQHIANKLSLKNVAVHGARIEDSSPELKSVISCCISRAFSDFGKFLSLSEPMLMPKGEAWAMKAKLLDEDLATIPDGWAIKSNHLLNVPNLDAERRLFELVRVRELNVND